MFNRGINYDGAHDENAQQYRKRWNSIRIIYLTMFFDSLSFSVVLASLWPYLQKVSKEPGMNPTYLGWANVSFHVTGILVDFVMGYWTNKRGSMEPLLVSLVFFGLGNFLYGYAQACASGGVTVIILSRGVIGLSTGVNVVARAALADSTTLKERTTAMAHMSVLQGVGFAFGPAVQLLSIPLGDQGVYLPFLKLHLNLYTAPAFVSMFISALNAFLILGYYYEYRINIYKDEADNDDMDYFRALLSDGGNSDIRYDKTAVIVLLVLYFVAQKAFALFETILPPLTMDMLAWTREETAMYASVLFLAAGVIAIFAFAISETMEKLLSSDKRVLLLGFILIFLGFLIHLPWGKSHPGLKTLAANMTQNNTIPIETGCPEIYTWCKTIPKLYISQIIVGIVFLSIGYPFVMVFTSSIYSKVLGPNPQGIMQSWYGATGGVARICAPIVVTYLYVVVGPRWTFISVNSLVVLSIILYFFTYQKLVPYHIFVLNKNVNSNANIILMTTQSSETRDFINEIETSEVILRRSLNLDNYCLRASQARFSLIDRRSYYDGATYETQLAQLLKHENS